MKKYKAEKMAAVSRYSAYFQTLPADLRRQVHDRINELVQAEKEFCDRGNYKHLSQILTSIALYEVLQKNGYSEEEAFRIRIQRQSAFFRLADEQVRTLL